MTASISYYVSSDCIRPDAPSERQDMYYSRLADRDGKAVYALDENLVIQVDRRHPFCFVPALISMDMNSGRCVSASYVMLQDRRIAEAAMKELSVMGLSFRRAALFSRRICSLAQLLSPFAPFLSRRGNAPVIEVYENGKDGRRLLNLMDLLDRPESAGKVDWKRTEKLYRGRDVVIELEEVRRRRRSRAFNVPLPESFMVSLVCTEPQKDQLDGFVRRLFPRDHARFLMTITEIQTPSKGSKGGRGGRGARYRTPREMI